MLTLKQLTAGVTEDEALEFYLELLTAVGFKATSWQSTSAARYIVQVLARVTSDLTTTIANNQKGVYAGLAKDEYADNLGKYSFSLDRVPATATEGYMVLSSEAAAPIHTWDTGELLIADAPQGEAANTFEVIGSGELNPGESVPVFVRAAIPGAASARVPANSTTLVLWTPLIGVTVTNPPAPPTTPVNNWVTRAGEDQETTGEGGRYNARMMGRFERTGYNNTEGAYRAWCLEALPALTRLSIREGALEGEIRIVGATVAGGLTGAQTGFYPNAQTGTGQIGAILAYLTGATDGVGRRPINDRLTVVSANQVTTPPLVAFIIVKSPFAADAVAAVSEALRLFLTDPALSPIGGKKLQNWTQGRVLIADLYRVVMAVQGVLDVTFSPSTDINLGAEDIYSPTVTVQMVVQP